MSDDWTLTPEQFEFMGPRWKAILDSLFGDERLVVEIEGAIDTWYSDIRKRFGWDESEAHE